MNRSRPESVSRYVLVAIVNAISAFVVAALGVIALLALTDEDGRVLLGFGIGAVAFPVLIVAVVLTRSALTNKRHRIFDDAEPLPETAEIECDSATVRRALARFPLTALIVAAGVLSGNPGISGIFAGAGFLLLSSARYATLWQRTRGRDVYVRARRRGQRGRPGFYTGSARP
jgi:hypothetical protein